MIRHTIIGSTPAQRRTALTDVLQSAVKMDNVAEEIPIRETN
jgi:hypothetical protein